MMNSSNKIKWILVNLLMAFVFLFCSLRLFAQDTLSFESKALKGKWLERPTGFLLQGQIIKSVNAYNLVENLINSMPANAKKNIGDTCYLSKQVLVSASSLNKLQSYYTKLYFPTSKIFIYKSPSHFTIENTRLNGSPDISNLYLQVGKLAALNHDTLSNLHVTNTRGWVSLYDNKIAGDVEMTQCNLDQLDFSENDFIAKTATFIAVNQSMLKKVSLIGNNFNNVVATFANDTLSGMFDLSPLSNASKKTASGGKASFIFKNCVINAKFILSDGSKFISAKFINCSFGKDVDLENLFIGQLIFDNCNTFAAPIDLNVINSSSLGLSFINSDLKNFKLNYLGKFHLFFPDSTKGEDMISTYENLLAKFKLEGKLESFQNVDIAYTQFKDEKAGVWGSIRGFISRCWWYYSYRKYYILFWTAGFLVIFFCLNILWWPKLKAVYPVISELPRSKYYNSSSPEIEPEKKSYLTILIFTAFIFFSLRINFEKLVYQDRKTLAYFFIQYILGLVCVFFIVNAILKI